MRNSSSYFVNLKSRYLSFRLGEIILWSLSVGALVYSLSYVFRASALTGTVLSLLFLAITAVIGFRRFGLQNLSEKRFVKYINTSYPELEESVDLLLKDEGDMTSLERLQRERTIIRFEKIFPTIQLPQQLGRAAILFFVAIGFSFVLIAFAPRKILIADSPYSKDSIENRPLAIVPTAISTLTITIIPPAYTGLKKQRVADPQLILPEGTMVNWNVKFSDRIQTSKLIFSGRDTVSLKSSNESFTITREILESGFYQIYWQNDRGEIRTSDFYKIDVVYDRSPDVKFENLRQSTELTILDKQSLQIRASASDDYAITDSYIVATVAKGSGESVKFREEKLFFTSPPKLSGKSISASRAIDLKQLGLEPGDELYFYAEAIDNHAPIPQRSRTETYFISLQDTARQHLSVEAGLGVDLMPEYFRSQRQIIIDTEKLLAQRKTITKHQFNFTSNELGYDQKVLRLKYGEFLGEEFESEVAETEDPELPKEVQPEGEEGDEDADDPTKQFGHAHDEKENLHNLVEAKKGKDAEHSEGEEDPEKEKDPIAAYKHSHDNMEEATFFTQSIRAKLKAALTVMWDAELHLRMYEPEKSLPYQYQALKLLKEISNDSRIYVHKTGFEPPPLKEEKRLTGDLAEIKSSQTRADLLVSNKFLNSVKALELTDNLLQQPRPLSKNDIQTFRNAGQEISSLALQEPGKYLLSLSLLKTISENEVTASEQRNVLQKLKRSLFHVIPENRIAPAQQSQSRHALDKIFIQTLEAIRND
jgi:hypothetical protein